MHSCIKYCGIFFFFCKVGEQLSHQDICRQRGKGVHDTQLSLLPPHSVCLANVPTGHRIVAWGPFITPLGALA